MNNFQKSQQALIQYIKNETGNDPFCNDIGNFIDSNTDLQNFAEDCIDNEDDSVFNQGNANDLNLLDREVDRMLAPLAEENSIPHLDTIKKTLIEQLRQKYDSEKGNDKSILKKALKRQSTNLRILNEKEDEFNSIEYPQNMTQGNNPSVFIYPDKNSQGKFRAILRVSIPDELDQTAVDNPNRIQRKIVDIDITKDLEENENFSDAWRSADESLPKSDQKIIKEIARKKTGKAIIDSMAKKSPLDEFKQRIENIEQPKADSDMKNSAPILQALDDILENRAMTVAEYEELRDNILSGRVKGLTAPSAGLSKLISEKFHHHEQNMLIKPDVSLIDQQEVILLEDKIKMAKTDKYFNTVQRPTFLEYKSKEQLLHDLSTTYSSFAEGTAAHELADAIFTEALRIKKEEGNTDLAYDIVYDFLKSCKYAEKAVQDSGLTGNARDKEVFRQLTVRLDQQKAGTAKINDKDPNDSHSKEPSEEKFVRKPTKGVYTKIGGLGWMTSKAGRNVDKTVKNLKERLYPKQKQSSIWQTLFGWMSLGSDKTKNAEEQNSKHIQEGLGSSHETQDQTEKGATKIEMQKRNTNDENHITVPGTFHSSSQSAINPNQQKDRDLNDGQTHSDDYTPTH